MTNTKCSKYVIKTPDDGVSLSETYRVLYQIKLRNGASRWFLLQEYITMHGPMNSRIDRKCHAF